MSNETVRVVVIGTGGIGKHHLRTWQELTCGDVVGVYDIDAGVAKLAADQYGVKKVYDSLEEAVADDGVDVLDICTPNRLHREAVVAGLEGGRHCLCEKPLAIEPDDIRAMIAARDRSGKLLCTIQHMRFEEPAVLLKRAIDAGRLGHIYYARAWWLRRRMAPATPGFLSKAQAGLGPGVDLGVHMLDMAMFLMGFPNPVRVSGVSGTHIAPQADIANEWGTFRPEEYEVEDFGAGLVRFENGAVLSLEVSWLLNMVERETRRMWLHGTESGAEWPDLKFAHVRDGAMVDTTVATPLVGEGHKRQLAAFADAVLHRRPSPVPAEQSLTVSRVLSAMYESAALGREVAIDESGGD